MATKAISPSTGKKLPRPGFYCAEGVEGSTSDLAQIAGGPIIAAVNTPEMFEEALAAPPRTLYILTGSPLTLPALLKRGRNFGKLCLVNMDFLDGLARDRAAVEFLAANGAAGIVSTRMETLKVAQTLGLMTVQRTFVIDTAAVNAAGKSLTQFRPDALEVLPAMAAPRVGKRLREVHPGITIIGGGLIESIREIEELLAAGIEAVTTSNPHLWVV